MDEGAKQFYIPAAIATLVSQPEPDWSLSYTIAYQLEHGDPGFNILQLQTLLKCTLYLNRLVDDNGGPVDTCCTAMHQQLDSEQNPFPSQRRITI
ncbi:hypothetical protein Poly51_49250 [Rubripirellula tenax]|uniref:Uncharacterized protein n=2 Tax=Rubripirellula tenax TaxID=2528015 RepID=A0A5C6EN04_9BACT|nr:hypothetical protein Poly51_49250 [Rubripirellula tenax]